MNGEYATVSMRIYIKNKQGKKEKKEITLCMTYFMVVKITRNLMNSSNILNLTPLPHPRKYCRSNELECMYQAGYN
jgi:hypothetical protein